MPRDVRAAARTCAGWEYTVIFGYSYTNIHYCICIRICISIYSVYNIQTAWRQVLSSFVKFTMHSRAPIPLYILGRFYSYTNIHYTPTLQNIHYTTYIPTLRPTDRSLIADRSCTLYSCMGGTAVAMIMGGDVACAEIARSSNTELNIRTSIRYDRSLVTLNPMYT